MVHVLYKIGKTLSTPNAVTLGCPGTGESVLNKTERLSEMAGVLLFRGLDLDQSSRACKARATGINDPYVPNFYVPGGVTSTCFIKTG